MALIVYGASISPFVRKVRALLIEKNLPYQLDPVIPFNPPPEWRKISPLGKIPALRDGDRTVADSSVISAYLERRHPKPALYPSDDYANARALWFEEYADTALMAAVGAGVFAPLVILPMLQRVPPDRARAKKAVEEELPPLFDYLQGELGSHSYLVEDRFSIADISVASVLVNLHHCDFHIDRKRWPQLAAYIERIHARPSFKALIEEETPALAAMRQSA
jgi:glutathione S-transferase